MKILHVIDTLARGGAERLLVVLLPELARQGHEVAVAVRGGPYDLQAELEAKGIQVIRLPRRHKWNLIVSAWEIAQAIPQPDIIHAHLYFPTICTALARWLKLYKGITHATFHNLAYAGANRRTWKLEARRLLGRFLVRRGIDQPQAVSKASADHYAQAYQLDNVTVLHNAFRAEETRNIESYRGKSLVLPGRLVPEKGHLDLICALQDMRSSCPPIIFAGDGPLRSKLAETIAETGLPISITGALPHTQMLQTIASARLVVVPSRFEGFGLTALEALALGKAVIATTAGGLPEVLGEVGRQIAPADVRALTIALDTVLDDPDWFTTQERAGPRQAAKFDVANIAQEQILLYQKTYQAKRPEK